MKLTQSVSIALFSLLSFDAASQATDPNVDYNKTDRERVQKISEEQKKIADEQRKRVECAKDCDTIFRGQYLACAGYPLTAQATCNLNIDKNKAQCYQTCK